MTSVNQEFVSTLNETKQTVLEAIKSDNSNVFTIGTALANAVAVVDEQKKRADKKAYKDAYEAIFDELHFGKAVAKKFIKIAHCDYLRELHEDELTSKNLVWSYTSLYELAADKIAGNEENKQIIKDVFTAGFASVNGTRIASRKLTLKDIRVLTNQVSNDKVDDEAQSNTSDSESEQSVEDNIISSITHLSSIADETMRKAMFQEIEIVLNKYENFLNQKAA